MGDINTGIWGLLDEGRPQEGLKLTYSAGDSLASSATTSPHSTASGPIHCRESMARAPE
jgi:hypothetical protein